MAKKKTTARRVPRASEPRMFGDGKPSQVAPQTDGRPAQASAPAGGRPAAGRFAAAAGGRSAAALRVPVTTTQNYQYVVNDLRRLAIIAVATFAVLVALGLIIR